MIEVKLQPLNPADGHTEHEWRHLEKQAKASFFTSWDWTGTLFNSLPAETNLYLLRLAKQTETVGLAYLGNERVVRHLLVQSNRFHLNSLGERLITEDNQLVVRPELESAVWDAIFAWFAQKQNQADELVLPGLRESLDPRTLTRSGLYFHDTASRSHHVDLKRLEATSGRFTDLLSQNARYQLRRSIRDYGGSGSLTLSEAESVEEAIIWFDKLKVLHIDSWTRRNKTHAFSGPLFEAFHRNLIQRTFSAGRIQMLRIDADGRPIGYLYNFRDGPRTYAYQSGFSDKDSRLRPGAVSHALAVEHNFRLGVGVYDFMAGSNRLKTSFATDHRDMHWTTVQLPHLRFRLENMARRAKHHLWRHSS